VKNNKLKAWSVLGSYLLAYGLIRFSLEFIKIDNTLMVFGWRWPQIVSLLMILGGVILMGIKKDET
jgi:prolipoprotein diacylglyceryltransferase